MIKTILFDVDGTIVDTQKVIVLSTFKEVIKEYLNANVNINDLALHWEFLEEMPLSILLIIKY